MAVTFSYERARDSVSSIQKTLRVTLPSDKGNTSGPSAVDWYAHIGEKIAPIALKTTYAMIIMVEALTAETLG